MGLAQHQLSSSPLLVRPFLTGILQWANELLAASPCAALLMFSVGAIRGCPRPPLQCPHKSWASGQASRGTGDPPTSSVAGSHTACPCLPTQVHNLVSNPAGAHRLTFAPLMDKPSHALAKGTWFHLTELCKGSVRILLAWILASHAFTQGLTLCPGPSPGEHLPLACPSLLSKALQGELLAVPRPGQGTGCPGDTQLS